MKDGRVIDHNKKEKVINSKIFMDVNISKPIIYSLFNDLRKEGIDFKKFPTSIPEALELLEEFLKN